jgi:hypothetical protein
MNLYLVHGQVFTDNSQRPITEWCGSQAEANAIKKKFLGGGVDKKSIKIEPIDVPTDKAGLIAFLNKGNGDDD